MVIVGAIRLFLHFRIQKGTTWALKILLKQRLLNQHDCIYYKLTELWNFKPRVL